MDEREELLAAHRQAEDAMYANLAAADAARPGEPKVFCALLTTGVCDQITRAETAEAKLKDAVAALEKAQAVLDKALPDIEFDEETNRCKSTVGDAFRETIEVFDATLASIRSTS